MKNKTKICLIVISSVLLVTILITVFVQFNYDIYDGVYVGMTQNEFHKQIADDNGFSYLSYSFYMNQHGDHVVVHWDDKLCIDKIDAFRKISVDSSKNSFSKIKAGMTLYDVVSKVGIPSGVGGSGLIIMNFSADDGAFYRIYFDFDRSNNNMLVVTDVVKE